ncbi:hypothetical protein GWO43_01645 [candidate division KSB1 bacterium]|nr:hypothetical protein [candidate division KSB1 bacterium]NIR69427.1 hypothetical protein [candidate division KSB1 bacterium]NIS22781.1 hypothetical protein [candidate division KSB1 bacterium]NIT69621.1 hypothetical protein [candidate division KSB1 bacterium]NIU23290.1 hypothetical protein [candidate division KSB1 bacterium]
MSQITKCFLAFSLISFSCQSTLHEPIHALIQHVVLHAGKSDTLLITDLFYAQDYSLNFQPHPDIQVNYNQPSGKLVLKPANNFEGFTLLTFRLQGNEYQFPIYSRVKQRHVFKYQPQEKPDFRMNLMGNFNDWNRNSLPMHDEDNDGVYEIELKLDPGQYLYQFVVDSAEIWDPENPNKVDNGFGSYNSVVSIPPRHTDKSFLHVMGFEASDTETVLTFRYERENQPGLLKHTQIFALQNNREIPQDKIKLRDNQIEIGLDQNDLQGKNVIRVIATQAGQTTNLQTIHLLDGLPLSANYDGWSWHDAIIYAIMIDRYHDGDPTNTRPVQHDSLSPKTNYMGGDLQGIIQNMEEGYFDSLGVNVLWLSPVNENTDEAYREWPSPHRYFSGYHGYWPIHHEKVEERFGDLELLKQLVETAHKKQIRVLLDFMANHVHQDHPFYRKHRDWFGTLELPDGRKNIRYWDEFRLTTWFEPFLPSFDYQGSEEALQVMTDNAIWWVNQTGIDGFRHDAVKHIPNRFWRVLTQKVTGEIEIPQNRDLYQIGETFGSYDLISSYVKNGQLDAQFNFNLYDVALYVFLNADASFSTLDKELQKTISIYGPNHLMGNIMDSHDKVRYMAYADGDLELNSSDAKEIGWTNPPEVDDPRSYNEAELYLAYLLTIPGVPTLYYGDEIGMTGAADPDNRRMMRFGDELTTLEKQMLRGVRSIVKLRRTHSALRYGDFQTLLANQHCFVYLRSDMSERVLTALNKNNQPQTITVQFPDFYEATRANNLINGQTFRISKGTLSMTLPPIGWLVFGIE